MTAHHRRIKEITFTLGGNSYECQLTSYQVVNNTPDGDKVLTLCPDGEFIDDADDDYALNIKGQHDWTSSGISRFFVANNKSTADFTLVHLNDVTGEKVQVAGTCKIKCPNIGGDRSARDEFDLTFPLVGFDPSTDITYP